MKHDHNDRERLTFGCRACIRKARIANLVGPICDTLEAGRWDQLPDPFDTRNAHPWVEHWVYRELRRRGNWADHARRMIDAWWEEATFA